jgi:hypothetical protein
MRTGRDEYRNIVTGKMRQTFQYGGENSGARHGPRSVIHHDDHAIAWRRQVSQRRRAVRRVQARRDCRRFIRQAWDIERRNHVGLFIWKIDSQTVPPVRDFDDQRSVLHVYFGAAASGTPAL